MTTTKRITLAYSPDTDDAFMVHALRSGKVDCRGYDFECTSADIQVLNEKARSGTYDVTAISVAAYPSLAADYLLMPVGASIGDEFGPAIVVNEASPLRCPDELVGRRIAVPGRQTSAYFAACDVLGAFEAVPLNFLAIGPAVASGEVDAGILIHELQLRPEASGFRKLGDLGKLWWQRHRLPLPLGANAIRRSLGPAAVRDVTAILRASIEAGLADRSATLAAALAQSTADFLDLEGGDRYISMYVNHRSLALGGDVREAISRLFASGAAAGLCPRVALTDALYD